MDPGTIALIAMGVGTAVSAVGAIKQGQSANAVAQYNAKLSKGSATAARAAAAENAKREKRLGMKRQGDLRARGSSMDVLEDSAREEELNLLSILHGGEVQASGFGNTATLDRARGANAVTDSYFSAAGTLLKGGEKVAGNWPESKESEPAKIPGTP